MEARTFIGFYMGEGFWVDRVIDLNDLQHDERLRGIIPEVVMIVREEHFEIRICADGLLLLRIDHLALALPDMSDPSLLEPAALWWRNHLDFANALQLLIESESRKCEDSSDMDAVALSMEQTSRVYFHGDRPVTRTSNQGRNLLTVRAETLEWINGGRRGHLPTELCDRAWWVWGRVGQQALSNAIARFRLTVDDRNRIKLLSMIVQAKTAHSDGHYATAYVLFWFAIESSVRAFAGEIHRGAKSLKSHEAIDLLSTAKVIDSGLAQELHDLRKFRNEIMHKPGTTVCTPSHTGRAAQAAITMSTFRSGLELRMGWQTTAQF